MNYKRAASKIASMIIVFVLMVLFMPQLTVSASSTTVPSGAKQYKGHTYYVYKKTTTWKKAKALCEKKGGHLVTITSEGENNFVKSLIEKADIGYCWLGASDADEEGNWEWITGEKFKFSDWYYGQPDNYESEENYLSSYLETKWNDYPNDSDSVTGYVCEWDMTKKQANSVRISKTSATIKYGSTEKLKVLNTSSKVSWSSSKKKVATVNSKGVVTAKGLGKATITAKVGSKKYTCKVTVKDANAEASVKVETTDGGYFISGISSAKITVTPKSNCAEAVVTILNTSDEKVYSTSLTSLAKGKKVTYTWDGKNSKGKYVDAGSYQVKVTIGSKTSEASSYLSVKEGGDFEGGTGSVQNPFLVNTSEQLKKIYKYPDACFKQIADIALNYESAGNFFTLDNPFNGVYDGNGKTISGIIVNSTDDNVGLFKCIGEKGTVQNLSMTNCVFQGKDHIGILAGTNCGTINNCSVVSCSAVGKGQTGAVVGYNTGTIKKSASTNNEVSSTEYGNTGVGGICGQSSGTIIDSTSDGNSVKGANYPAGIAGINSGSVLNCEVSNATFVKNNYYGGKIAGVVAKNSGVVNGCVYDGAYNQVE